MDNTIYNKLLPGEEILWQGQPQKVAGSYFANNPTAIHGVPLTIFSSFALAMFSWGATLIKPINLVNALVKYLCPLPPLFFLYAGIYFLFIVPYTQSKRNLSTFYYLTNKRIIINVDTEKSPSFKSLLLSDLRDIKIDKETYNIGTIIFPKLLPKKIYYNEFPAVYNSFKPATCFYRIKDADDVYTSIVMNQQLYDRKENESKYYRKTNL